MVEQEKSRSARNERLRARRAERGIRAIASQYVADGVFVGWLNGMSLNGKSTPATDRYPGAEFVLKVHELHIRDVGSTDVNIVFHEESGVSMQAISKIVENGMLREHPSPIAQVSSELLKSNLKLLGKIGKPDIIGQKFGRTSFFHIQDWDKK